MLGCQAMLLVLLVASGIAGDFMETVVAQEGFEFDEGVAKHFANDVTELEDARTKAQKLQKPLMLLLMPTSCSDCPNFVKSIKDGLMARELLNDFVVVHASGKDRAKWVPESMLLDIPQALFEKNSKIIHVPDPIAGKMHHFADDASLASGMIQALKLAGGPILAEDWAPDVLKHFHQPATSDAVRQKALETKKPILVLITTRWCRACLALRGSINSGLQTKWMLDDFVVLYSEGGEDVKQWQEKGQDYIPQAHFFDEKGGRLEIEATPQYKRYFSDDETLAMGMRKALKLMGRTSKMPKQSPWAQDIAEAQTDSMEPSVVKKEAAAVHKPLMVVITQPYCKVCRSLLQSVNAGTKVRKLLSKFVFTSVVGDHPMQVWQEKDEYYIPQAYFYNDEGALIDVRGPQEKFKRFFTNDDELADAMQKALDLAKVSEL